MCPLQKLSQQIVTLFKGIKVSDRFETTVHGRRRYITIAGREFWWPFPIAHWLNSSGAIVLGYPVYGDDLPKWVRPLSRLFRRLLDAKYWVAYRTWDRYHIVDTGLEPRYYDIDEVMFHACFALLGRFVELELGPQSVDMEDECCYRFYRLHSCGGTDQKAIDLWLWYKEELPKLQEEYWDRATGRKGRRSFEEKYGTDLEGLKEQKLKELIELRRCLWT
jgi:hypothetical protein